MTSRKVPKPYHPFRSIHTEVPVSPLVNPSIDGGQRMNFQLDQRSSYTTLTNSFGASFPPHQQHLAPPHVHTITPSYSIADGASFGTPIPGPTSPVGGPVLSISSETSASSGQGTTVASPIALTVAAAVSQDPQGTRRYVCDECGASFSQKQVRDHHIKDQHSPPGTCPMCSRFVWPRGRPGLLKAHIGRYHLPPASQGAQRR
jgi:DNA-directed RNA polymerase subunit RPC12/RpoP